MRGFADAVRDGVLISDGGLATELETRGHDLSDGLWSARLLRDDPAAVLAVHRSFFASGAVIATSASYQASFSGFAARGLDRGQAVGLLRRSVRLAVQARDEAAADGRRRFVAASVGPYGAALADGSEYRGRYGVPVARLAAWHRPRLETLAEAGPDVLACETVPDVAEAEALGEALAGLGVPAWLSFTARHGRTRAGQPLREAFALAGQIPQVVAVGVNCCDPAEVPAAVRLAGQVSGKPVVAYPNSGERWLDGRWSGPSRFDPTLRGLLDGHGVVGGCCRVGPAQIAELASALGR